MPYSIRYSGKTFSKNVKNSGWLKVKKESGAIASHHKTKTMAKKAIIAYHASR